MALILGFERDKFTALIGGISPLYLVFLGGPFAAAVMAKVTVSNAVAGGNDQRSIAVSPRPADVFSDDDGNTDLVDLQYVAFNVLVAAIVVVQFTHAPGYGAPAVPDFLAALTGTSAATYVANKALVSGNTPTVDRLTPATTRAGGQVVALGANLIAQGETKPPKVFLNTGAVFINNGVGVAVTDDPPRPDQATFRVPPGSPACTASVTIRTPSGLSANPSTLMIVPDSITASSLDKTDVPPHTNITLTGSGFFAASDVDSTGAPLVAADGRPVAQPATVSLVNQAPNGQEGSGQPRLCGFVSGTDSQLTVTVPEDILTQPGETPGYFNFVLQRAGVPDCHPTFAINVH